MYISVQQALSMLSYYGGKEAFAELSEEDKNSLIASASTHIDAMFLYAGEKREGSEYFFPVEGETEAPKEVKEATAKMLYFLIDERAKDGITSEKIGSSIAVTYIPVEIKKELREILRPLIANNIPFKVEV